jgi:DNA repair protein RadC
VIHSWRASIYSSERCYAAGIFVHRLRGSLALVDICVLVHLIVAGGDIVSFAERRLL